jgi:hypothetical protein
MGFGRIPNLKQARAEVELLSMTDLGAAAGEPLDLMAASQALAGIRGMLAADGYDMSLRVLGTDTLAVEILAGPDACAECLVPMDIMSGIVSDALGSSAPAARIQLSYPAESSH